jgi:hypothetical protein
MREQVLSKQNLHFAQVKSRSPKKYVLYHQVNESGSVEHIYTGIGEEFLFGYLHGVAAARPGGYELRTGIPKYLKKSSQVCRTKPVSREVLLSILEELALSSLHPKFQNHTGETRRPTKVKRYGG